MTIQNGHGFLPSQRMPLAALFYIPNANLASKCLGQQKHGIVWICAHRSMRGEMADSLMRFATDQEV